jgi:[acyl-carrier-protein] S-malonyltransferase
MGKDLLDSNPEFNSVYEMASDILGFDLKKICFESDAQTLSRTIYSQPAIMATSLLCFEAAKKNDIEFQGVGGHSLGEYSALVAAEILTPEDGFRVIKARSEAMEKAAQNTDGSMAAILKLTPQEVEGVCHDIEGYVEPVNYNSPVQTVIAGERSAVEEACEKFKELKARVMPLKVSAAFHSELMKEAAEEFYENIDDIKFNNPKEGIHYFSNVTGDEFFDFIFIKDMLKHHMVSPVRFTNELRNMRINEFKNFIELGPGKVLTGLVKKTLPDAHAYNIENNDTLEAFLADYRKED